MAAPPAADIIQAFQAAGFALKADLAALSESPVTAMSVAGYAALRVENDGLRAHFLSRLTDPDTVEVALTAARRECGGVDWQVKGALAAVARHRRAHAGLE